MTKELNQYYQEVRRHLTCPKGEQDCLLAQTHQMVVELQESNPNLGYSDVVDFLGEPQELASTFMERMDPAKVEAYQKKKKIRAANLKSLTISIRLRIIIIQNMKKPLTIQVLQRKKFTFQKAVQTILMHMLM